MNRAESITNALSLCDNVLYQIKKEGQMLPHKADDPDCREVVARLAGILGRRLTAYAGGARDVREIDRWLAGEALDAGRENRFRLTLRIAEIMLKKDAPEVVQAWFIGLNPELGDRVPLNLLREEPMEAITDDLIAATTVMLLNG